MFSKYMVFLQLEFRDKGAIVVDNLELANFNKSVDFEDSGAQTALLAEFKISLNAYLEELLVSPVRSLSDVIAFNEKFSDLVSRMRSSIRSSN